MSTDIYSLSRELAQKQKYQILYAGDKYTGIRIFKNEYDLSHIQEIFICFLGIYNAVNTDIHLQEVKEVVLENDEFVDSYLIYKRKKREETKKETKNDNNFSKKDKEQITTKSSWIFRKKKK